MTNVITASSETIAVGRWKFSPSDPLDNCRPSYKEEFGGRLTTVGINRNDGGHFESVPYWEYLKPGDEVTVLRVVDVKYQGLAQGPPEVETKELRHRCSLPAFTRDFVFVEP